MMNVRKAFQYSLGCIIPFSIMLSCTSAHNGIQENITFHGEQLHHYLTVIYDEPTANQGKTRDTISYYCNAKGQPVIERWGTDSLHDCTFTYVGDTIRYNEMNPQTKEHPDVYFILKDGLIIETSPDPAGWRYTYDKQRKLICRDEPNVKCGSLRWDFQWKGTQISNKNVKTIYRKPKKQSTCYDFRYLHLFGSTGQVPLPFITLGYMGMIPEGDMEGYKLPKDPQGCSYTIQITSDYDRKGRPVHSTEITTSIKKNKKKVDSKLEIEYIW